MFAIREANSGYGVGGRSADKHYGEWYSESKGRWTPASNEASEYEDAEEAQAVVDTLGRECVIVEV